MSDVVDVISAVQTRVQEKTEAKGLRPVKHTIIDAINISRGSSSSCKEKMSHSKPTGYYVRPTYTRITPCDLLFHI